MGSNDLTQYLLAVDRNNPRVAGLYNSYHPAVLQALQYIVTEAQKEKVQVSICGEMAGDPGGALLLLAMGYEVLSMNSINLPRVKSAIRGVTFEQCTELLEAVMVMDGAEQIQAHLSEMLEEAGLGRLARPVIPNGSKPS